MKFRRFGSTDLLCSEVGLGCQSLGGGLFNEDSAATTILRQAFDGGINFFDTADHYSMGRSEELIGNAFHRNRHEVVICTKIGTRYDAVRGLVLRMRQVASPFSNFLIPFRKRLHRFRAAGRRGDFSAPYVANAVESSLRRLRTEYIDVLLLHKPPSRVLEDEDLIRTLERLKESGKVRHLGVAAGTNADAVMSLRLPWVSTVQVTLSLVEQSAREEVPLTHSSEKAILARNPRGFGYLTEEGLDLTAEDYAYDDNESERLRSLSRNFKFLTEAGRSLSTAAIKYVLQQPGVTLALPRVTSPQQLQDILAAPESPDLTAEELLRIAEIWRTSRLTLRSYPYRSVAPLCQ